MADKPALPRGWPAPAAGSTAAGGGVPAPPRPVKDGQVPPAGILPGVGRDVTVLAIWAHPDDEITCAGTLARMAQAGARVVLLYLTKGEAAKGTGYDRASLAKVRAAEAQAAGEVLGASAVEVLDFPDGGLLGLNPAGPKGAIAEAINRHRPQVLISFDETVGFYGHPDHVRTGVWVREVFEAAPKRGPW
ncbi:MAG TPA: PIG-L family deacetylase, partial [Phenylobacterium sp.]|nr:PIG-L family deacetylase [Phenylobacterium sp.]